MRYKVNIMAQYVKTIFVSSLSQLDTMKPGQWVAFDSGNRGQYLGRTRAGVQVVRYQSGLFGEFKDTESNKLLRKYAKLNGAK
jgi:hypothetical protein